MYHSLAYTGSSGIVLLFFGQYYSVSWMTIVSIALLVIVLGFALIMTAARAKRQKKARAL